jgi:hypothetical protein
VRNSGDGSAVALIDVARKVSFCERSPGPCFQVLLETNGLPFGRKLDSDDQRPRAEAHGVPAGPVVVPAGSVLRVAFACREFASMLGELEEE